MSGSWDKFNWACRRKLRHLIGCQEVEAVLVRVQAEWIDISFEKQSVLLSTFTSLQCVNSRNHPRQLRIGTHFIDTESCINCYTKRYYQVHMHSLPCSWWDDSNGNISVFDKPIHMKCILLLDVTVVDLGPVRHGMNNIAEAQCRPNYIPRCCRKHQNVAVFVRPQDVHHCTVLQPRVTSHDLRLPISEKCFKWCWYHWPDWPHKSHVTGSLTRLTSQVIWLIHWPDWHHKNHVTDSLTRLTSQESCDSLTRLTSQESRDWFSTIHSKSFTLST